MLRLFWSVSDLGHLGSLVCSRCKLMPITCRFTCGDLSQMSSELYMYMYMYAAEFIGMFLQRITVIFILKQFSCNIYILVHVSGSCEFKLAN